MRQDYKAIADELARDIATGRIAVGSRLPPQRDFAFQRGIAASTASRVYGELRMRGLIVGETGRGSFVKHRFEQSYSTLLEPVTAGVDLELVSPSDPTHSRFIIEAVNACLREDEVSCLLKMSAAQGTAHDRAVVAELICRKSWQVAPASVLFSGNGRQAIAAALSAVAKPGQRVGVEALTYPFVKSVAHTLGLELVPIAMDDEGMIPEDLKRTIRSKAVTAVYIQPTLQSPLVVTMGAKRRHAIAEILRQYNIVAIEDGVYSFLADETPLAAHCPDHVVYLDSMSKRVMPGLTIGMIVAPEHLVDGLAHALRAGAWTAPNVSLATSIQLVTSGVLQEIVATKRTLAKKNWRIARRAFDKIEFQSDRRAFHGWLPLPPACRSDAFVAQAAQRGIAVAPGSAFAVSPGHAPQGIRLAITNRDPDILFSALRSVQDIVLEADSSLA